MSTSHCGPVATSARSTLGQAARRVWWDLSGAISLGEWNAGQLSRYSPAAGEWSTWPLPSEGAKAYAVCVDDADFVWVSDSGGNSVVRSDPAPDTFVSFPLPSIPGTVRHILGRAGEI